MNGRHTMIAMSRHARGPSEGRAVVRGVHGLARMQAAGEVRGRAIWIGLVLAGVMGCDDGSSEMEIRIVESGTISEGPVSVGQGLTFELDLRVGDPTGGFEPPTDLEVVPENAGDLLVEIVGVDPASSGQATLVRLTPLVPGPGFVRFFADNAVEDPTFRYDAVAVDEVELTAAVQGDASSATTGSEMTVFADSRLLVEASYRNGGVRVLGHERLEVDGGAGGGAATRFLEGAGDLSLQLLDLAPEPHDAIVRSAASGATFTVHAVDVGSIWRTELEVDGAPFTSDAPYVVTVGDDVVVELQARSRAGARIWGMPTTPAAWVLHGDSIEESSREANGARFSATARGQTTVQFTYGDAQAALVVDVTN